MVGGRGGGCSGLIRALLGLQTWHSARLMSWMRDDCGIEMPVNTVHELFELQFIIGCCTLEAAQPTASRALACQSTRQLLR
jgi:hypothetical protein